MWEVIMGLEVHAELSTKSKIFCGCSTEFGGEPNTHVCPICSGMPGTLPKLNQDVVEYAIRLGLALDCDITKHSKFDRKNYFYPDLPKAYQVSQLYAPICQNGVLNIGEKDIRIREIHMEEDAGKLIHNGDTKMDFNRCGVPLLEIVTQPDFRNSGEVISYLEKLREILLYLDICDCKMQEGSMRADVNISVHRIGEELGVRTEMKNLNSFKAIARAIEYESQRQLSVIKSGGFIVQETRRWDDDRGESYSMRSKENAQDYRYFPEPDLLPLFIQDERLAQARESLPELAHQKRERYARDYKISEKDSAILTSDKNISDLFEEIVELTSNSRESANLLIGSIMRLLKQNNVERDSEPESNMLSLYDNKISQNDKNLSQYGKRLAFLVNLVSDGKINRNAYKETVEAVFYHDVEPEEYIIAQGLMMVNDVHAVSDAVNAVIAANDGAVADYIAGKEKAFGFLMGQVMKRLKGTGNPDTIRVALLEKLLQ